MDLVLAAAKLALGKLSSEEAIASASSALDRGVYSESLGQLLFTPPVWSEVRPLFEKGLSELAIAVPSRSTALQVIAQDYARQIVAGGLLPYEGSRRIWREVAKEPDADPSLLVFVGLASEWEDSPQFRSEYDADIIAAAQRLLGTAEQGDVHHS